MKQEIIKIKVLTGAPELEGMKLSLVKIDEGAYICINSKIEIVDAWEELDIIEEYNKTSGESIFFDMHIFSTSFGKELKFIDEVEFLGTKSMLEESLEKMGIKINRINVEPIKEGECPF